MKTDIEIAQEAVMQPIKEVAVSYGIGEDDLEPVSYTHLDVYKRQERGRFCYDHWW